MGTIAPLPENQETEVTKEIDSIIARIDQCLPVILKKGAQGMISSDTPTKAFQPARIMQTRQLFQDMADNPLLTESGEDIKVEPSGRVRLVNPRRRKSR